MKAVLDVDFILYECASVVEERYIVATHIPTGEKMEFSNKTELWGGWKNKDGGWIAEENTKAGEVIYRAEEFKIEECQRLFPALSFGKEKVPPFEAAKRLLAKRIYEVCTTIKADQYFGFTGEGDTFRHKAATLLPYKGNRTEMLRPLLLKQLAAWAVEHHDIKVVTEIEADDAVSMAVHQGYEAWKASGDDDDKVVGIAVDKDSKGVQGFWFNPTKDSVVREIKGLGQLWLDEKDNIDGCGRMWLYHQICHGDVTDNYKSNCFSGLKWGEKSSYNALKDCKTDKEAWEVLVSVFKKLYPEPKDVITFLGTVRIDWLYVLQEMATLAFMLRHDGDKIVVKDVLNKLGINYD